MARRMSVRASQVRRSKMASSTKWLLFAVTGFCLLLSCSATCTEKPVPQGQSEPAVSAPVEGDDSARAKEAALLEQLASDHKGLMQIVERYVEDELVLAAMRKVKRHLFVDRSLWGYAYVNRPLPIGEEQTISQPSLVAAMTELLELKGGEKVLEIGTGSGYQAAILAEIAKEVYTIEIVSSLAASAEKRLKNLGYKNVTVKCGDGYLGWPEHAPFDAIIVTCGAPEILQPLVDQLRDGGIMVSPVGKDPADSILKKITRHGDSITVKDICGVGFVPMTGEAQKKKK